MLLSGTEKGTARCWASMQLCGMARTTYGLLIFKGEPSFEQVEGDLKAREADVQVHLFFSL